MTINTSEVQERVHVVAPAKLNLTLEIVGRRADGYHLLETVMQSIDVADVITVTAAGGATVVRGNGDDVPNGDGNLAAQAVAALRAAVAAERGLPPSLPGLTIDIDKRIPVAAGLGGGSADAAAALVAANELWGLQLTKEQLAAVGVEIGADVPFCLHGGTAVARGIGEQLTPVTGVPLLSGVIVNPGFPVSTADVYRRLREASKPGQAAASERTASGQAALGRTLSGRAVEIVDALKQRDVAAVGALLHNALEPVTTAMHPEVGTLRQRMLEAGAFGAVMCGSGPSVFGLARDAEHAAVLGARLRDDAAYVAVCRFLPHGGRLIEAGRLLERA